MTDIATPTSRWPAPEMCGLTEVAEILGVSRQRASQIVKSPEFPDPVQVIAAGSLWAQPEVKLYAESLPPAGQRRPGPTGPRWYYIEVAYHDPTDPRPDPGFVAWVGQAANNTAADTEAAEETRRLHPHATRIETWASRVVSETKARRLQADITAGTLDPDWWLNQGR